MAKRKTSPRAVQSEVGRTFAPADDWQSEARRLKWSSVDVNALDSMLRVSRGKIVSLRVEERSIVITETVRYSFLGTGADGREHEHVHERDYSWTWRPSYDSNKMVMFVEGGSEPVAVIDERPRTIERVPCECPVHQGKLWLHERDCVVGEYRRMERMEREVREMEAAEEPEQKPVSTLVEGVSAPAGKKQLSLF